MSRAALLDHESAPSRFFADEPEDSAPVPLQGDLQPVLSGEKRAVYENGAPLAGQATDGQLDGGERPALLTAEHCYAAADAAWLDALRAMRQQNFAKASALLDVSVAFDDAAREAEEAAR